MCSELAQLGGLARCLGNYPRENLTPAELPPILLPPRQLPLGIIALEENCPRIITPLNDFSWIIVPGKITPKIITP